MHLLLCTIVTRAIPIQCSNVVYVCVQDSIIECSAPSQISTQCPQNINVSILQIKRRNQYNIQYNNLVRWLKNTALL